MYFGLVPVVSHSVKWTVPILLSGFIATGSIKGSILQLFNLILGVLIYIPFVKISEKKQTKEFVNSTKAMTADMADVYKRQMKGKLFLRYVLIMLIFVLLGLFIVYMFDDVLNGLIIDVLQLINGNPFETFSKLFKVFLPFIVACFCFILVYFLCKDLTYSMRTLMDGMDDIMRKQRNKVVFPKEMRKAQGALMKVVDEYQAYLKSAKDDEEKKKDLIYLLAQDIRMPLAKIMMYLDFLESEQRISSEVKMDYIVHVLDESLLLEDMMNEFFDITRFNLQYAKWTPEEMFMDRMMEQVIDCLLYTSF